MYLRPALIGFLTERGSGCFFPSKSVAASEPIERGAEKTED
jgi:hypothetical protein